MSESDWMLLIIPLSFQFGLWNEMHVGIFTKALWIVKAIQSILCMPFSQYRRWISTHTMLKRILNFTI